MSAEKRLSKIWSKSILNTQQLSLHYEYVPCDLCGEDNTEIIEEIPMERANEFIYDRVHATGLNIVGFPPIGRITFVKCRTCSLVYMNPRYTKQAVEDFYNAYYSLQDETQISSAQVQYHPYYKTEKNRYNRVVDLGYKSGKVLDIGCGLGWFLEQFPDTWERFGTEVSHEAAQKVKERLNATVYEGDIFSARFSDNAFDVIALNSVIEHLRNPIDMLVEARRILRPDGLLLFNVPNISCVSQRISSFLQTHFDGFTVEHLYYFNQNIIEQVLSDLGFELSFITTKYPNSSHIIRSQLFLRPIRFLWIFKQFVRLLARRQGRKYHLIPSAPPYLPTQNFHTFLDWVWREIVLSFQMWTELPFSCTSIGNHFHWGANLSVYAKKSS